MKSIVHGPALDELILQDVNPFEDLVHGVPVVGPTLSNATGNITLVSLGGVLGDPASTRVWFIQDSQNSVIAITNSTGFVLEGYEYHPYGDPVIYRPGPNGVVEWGGDDVVVAESNYAVVNLYTGREWDHESGLYHYRSRYMSPMMGRFISSDTIGVWGDPNNLGNGYAYVGNGPFDGTDPLGEKKCKKWNVACKVNKAVGSIADKVEDVANAASDAAQHAYHSTADAVAKVVDYALATLEAAIASAVNGLFSMSCAKEMGKAAIGQGASMVFERVAGVPVEGEPPPTGWGYVCNAIGIIGAVVIATYLAVYGVPILSSLSIPPLGFAVIGVALVAAVAVSTSIEPERN